MEMYMDERLARIRESERKSHTEIYMNEELYNTNSWLQKPIKTVQEISLLFDDYNELIESSDIVYIRCSIEKRFFCINMF